MSFFGICDSDERYSERVVGSAICFWIGNAAWQGHCACTVNVVYHNLCRLGVFEVVLHSHRTKTGTDSKHTFSDLPGLPRQDQMPRIHDVALCSQGVIRRHR